MATLPPILSALFELDDLGILRTTKIPSQFAWMTEMHHQLLVEVLRCGEDGLSRRRMKKMPQDRQEALHMLELRDYLQWERDRFGQLTFLCLTWKGEEAARTILTVARNQEPPEAPAPEKV